MKNETVEVLVIGAGPSGCVAASYLHNNGVKVKVVEKSQFPRFVIGESLLPRCMDHFEEADLLDCLMAGQFEKKRGARFLRKDDLCTFDFSKKHTQDGIGHGKYLEPILMLPLPMNCNAEGLILLLSKK